MPFTPSHVAAALPFLPPAVRRGWVTTGLVIGCMVPDLPYYLPPPLAWDSEFTHTLAGVVTVDLLAGLVCVVLWHALIGPAAVEVAPAAVRARVRPPRPVRSLLRAPALTGLVVGLVLGALTHVWWDAFTHVGRFGPRHVAWLATTHGPLEGYRWAQYGSGVFGVVVLGLAAWSWWRRTSPRTGTVDDAGPRARAVVWTAVLGGLVLGAVGGLLDGVDGGGSRHAVFLVAVSSGGTAAVAALVCASVLAARRPPVR